MRTVVITGANVGIGFAAAKYLTALPGLHVLLACRDERKANAAIASVRQSVPYAQVGFVPLDLFSLASVRRLAGELASMTIPPIGGLILNAGGINLKAKSLEFTEDGFERTFQLNFLGHFLLANLLIKRMAAQARIIYVSSDLHDPAATRMGKMLPPRYGPVRDLALGTGTATRLKPMARYGTAKMYAVMTAYELDRKLQEAGRTITVNSWSPGVVPTTQAGRGMSPILKLIMMSHWFVNFMGSHRSTEEEAGRALGGLLTDAKYSGLSGRYFDGFREIPSSVESQDKSKARSVWEQSARLVGLSEEDAALFTATPARNNVEAIDHTEGLRAGPTRETRASD
jgi:NAD(P)-dependent dehydrogenase (short-subunit alcohol dehydrogenase family)